LISHWDGLIKVGAYQISQDTNEVERYYNNKSIKYCQNMKSNQDLLLGKQVRAIVVRFNVYEQRYFWFYKGFGRIEFGDLEAFKRKSG
jgi:hypothetical protein